jgi:hypothetical protein
VELKSQTIIEVLKNLIGGEVVNTPLGKGLSIDAREAFLFCAIAGGSYFENQIYPFTPKGLLKVFYNANNFNLVTGIFDNVYLKNTPHYIVEQRSYIKNNVKTIVPIDIESELSFRKKIKDIYGPSGSDADIVLVKVDLSKKGFGLEPFMEYLACKYFTNLGYITENQIPLSHSLGSPDFGGYSLEKIQTIVQDSGLLPRGFNVLELAMLRTFPQKSIQDIASENDDLIVGEAKTSTTQMKVQLEKYIGSGLFNSAVEIHPTKKFSSNSNFGLLTIKNYNLLYNRPLIHVDFSNQHQRDYKKWLEAYFNSYLLANYTNDELNVLAKTLIGKTIDSGSDIISLIKDVSFQNQFTILLGFLINGTIQR